jgi:hypothetical protein
MIMWFFFLPTQLECRENKHQAREKILVTEFKRETGQWLNSLSRKTETNYG